MDDIIGPIKTYFAKRDPSTIENATFKLHVRVTFALMLACMALVSCCSMMMMMMMVMMIMMMMMMIMMTRWEPACSATLSTAWRTECRGER